jgi:GT2 family glycosyltransferase
VESGLDLDALLPTLVSLDGTAPGVPVLVIDDRSPAPFGALIEQAAGELGQVYVSQDAGEGVAGAANVALTVAAERGMDCCLVAAGLTLRSEGWLDRLAARTGRDGRPAAVAGGAVVGPTGLIHHAGYFYSLLKRSWGSRLHGVPEELLTVDEPVLCPVSDALQLVRHEWVQRAGLYDETFDTPVAGLEYCLRVAAAGGQCVYEPTVRAIAAVREQDLNPASDDALQLRVKHDGMDFSPWVPEVI